jgi:hypothetical protein
VSEANIVNLPASDPTTSLARFMPQNIADLTRFADTIARSGLFGNVTPQQALVVMIYGAEVGLNPLAAMREIYLIPGRGGRIQMLPSAALTSARIQQSGDCEAWETDTDAKHCTIRFQRKGRQPQTLTVTIADIPARYFEPSKAGQPSQWVSIPEDMLYAWTVRRVARRHFADKLIAIQPEVDELDEARVIDVAKVEHQIDHRQSFGQCATCFHGALYLEAGRNGGAYLRCGSCFATFPPPQEVRDAVRGTPEHLTLAGAAEPVLEPGERIVCRAEDGDVNSCWFAAGHEGVHSWEREDAFAPEPVDANDSAVQSESERDTLDGEDVVAVPASAENAPIPEPVAPEDANQAMRNAVYQHFIRPRPPHAAIEMRGLLDEFGWKGGESLGDWMLGLEQDKLVAVSDAMAGLP